MLFEAKNRGQVALALILLSFEVLVIAFIISIKHAQQNKNIVTIRHRNQLFAMETVSCTEDLPFYAVWKFCSKRIELTFQHNFCY